MRRVPLAAALTLALCAAAPARAGLFSDDEARRRLEQLRTEVTALTEKSENTQRAQFQTANQLEALKTEIARLRGQLEVLSHELESAQKRQKDFYVDLDNRLRKMGQAEEARAAAAQSAPPGALATAPGQPAAGQPAADPANEARDYEAALNLIRGGKFREAAQGFEAFIRNYPASSFQPAAHYWMASAHFQLREFNRASDLYILITTRYPDDVKAPDAWLGIANCQVELGDTKGARRTLETVQKKYAGTPQADLATKRLARLK